jgi:hypothetical protein
METIEISKAELKRELFEDVLFLQLAEAGAMDINAGTFSLVKPDGKMYRINFIKGDICYQDIEDAFPVMKTWNFALCGNGGAASDGWVYFYMGMGCHLVIHESVHEAFCRWRDRGEGKAKYPVRIWQSFAEKILGIQE